jgi:hypothetical protein
VLEVVEDDSAGGWVVSAIVEQGCGGSTFNVQRSTTSAVVVLDQPLIRQPNISISVPGAFLA